MIKFVLLHAYPGEILEWGIVDQVNIIDNNILNLT